MNARFPENIEVLSLAKTALRKSSRIDGRLAEAVHWKNETKITA